MAAHRYWRLWLYLKNYPGSGSFSIAEVQLRESQGGSDVTGSGTASSSSVWSTGNLPANAFDDNTSTDWGSAASTIRNQWLAYDFGAGNEKDIVEAVITAITDSIWGPRNSPKDFALQYSDDNSIWVTKYLYLGLSWSSGESKTFNSSNAVSFSSPEPRRYWRLYFPTISDAWSNAAYCGLGEAEFRESISGSDATGSGAADADSYYDAGTVPSKLFDNSTSTAWSSSGSGYPHWVSYDFGSGVTKTILEVSLTSRNDTGYPQAPNLIILQMSSDGSTWVNVAESGPQTGWTQNQTRVFSVPVSGYTLSCATGSFTLTGQDANLPVTRRLSADNGSFSLTGQSAGLKANRRIVCEYEEFVVTGNIVDLITSRKVTVSYCEFTLTGQDATLSYAGLNNFSLSADVSSYLLSGLGLNFLVNRSLQSNLGTFTLTGSDQNLILGRKLISEVQSYLLTGNDLSYTVIRKLLASAGTFLLTFNSASLLYDLVVYTRYLDSIINSNPTMTSKVNSLITSPSAINEELNLNGRIYR